MVRVPDEAYLLPKLSQSSFLQHGPEYIKMVPVSDNITLTKVNSVTDCNIAPFTQPLI